MSSDNNTRESIEEETENDDDQIRQQQHQQKKKKEKEKEARIEFEKRLKGAKNLVMLPLRKLQKAYTRRKRRPPPAPFPYSEDLGGGGGGGGGSLGCHHLCFVLPRVSDPPHPDHDFPPLRTNPDAKASSYHDFLRSLLERNDFYSPEFNVHREI